MPKNTPNKCPRSWTHLLHRGQTQRLRCCVHVRIHRAHPFFQFSKRPCIHKAGDKQIVRSHSIQQRHELREIKGEQPSIKQHALFGVRFEQRQRHSRLRVTFVSQRIGYPWYVRWLQPRPTLIATIQKLPFQMKRQFGGQHALR